MDSIKENDYVLLYLDEKRKYLVKAEKGNKFHTHKGFILIDEIIGKRYGSSVKSSSGWDFLLLKPTIRDFIIKLARKTQIIYPKDAGYIALISGITSGSKVVEIGTGSGALTCVLASLVRPEGHVYSYEMREEFFNLAKLNIEKLGLSNYVTLKLKNAKEGIDEENVDSIVIDIADPWEVLENAYRSLRDSGIIVVFSPTVNQIEKTVRALREKNFVDIHVTEIIEREYQAEPEKLRPKTSMIAHTGYITWARKSVE
ncbi:MAG TPA: tRNA (adenine-N1)-methyltransferase [Geobacterales bacterium]|nr:tRNA (adenine-N1)-methyltransferase [Geobacterales bacterium]